MAFADDLKLARAGDTAAMARLFNGRRDYLRGLAKRILPTQLQPRVGQSDLVQDTFFKVIRGIHAFEGDSEEAFDHWLATAIRQACQDSIAHHLGTQKRNPDHRGRPDAEVVIKPDAGHLREATDSTPSYYAQQNEQTLLIARAKNQLNELQRQVITLRYEDKLTLREIAERLGKTEGQVTGAWRRALDRLSSLLVAERDGGGPGT